MRGLKFLAALLGLLVALGTAQMSQAQPGSPTFDYEWVKGNPLNPASTEATLRITMSGDIDDPTSPGLAVAGFNLLLEIDEGIVDETTVPVSGGGDNFSQIIPESPSDANAALLDSVNLVRNLTDYRLITDAYPASVYSTPLVDGRDEQNTMVWDSSSFLVEEISGAPAGKLWIIITGVAERLTNKLPYGDIPSMANALTTADAVNPLGSAGTTAGTSERAAFLDIKFTVLGTATTYEKIHFFNTPKVMANPLASEIFVVQDALPPYPEPAIPSDPLVMSPDGDSFTGTEGIDGGSAPAILEPYTAPTTDNASWNLYQ